MRNERYQRMPLHIKKRKWVGTSSVNNKHICQALIKPKTILRAQMTEKASHN